MSGSNLNLSHLFGLSGEAPADNGRWQDSLSGEAGDAADTLGLMMPGTSAASGMGFIGTGLDLSDAASHAWEGDFRSGVVDTFGVVGAWGGTAVGAAGGVMAGGAVAGPPGAVAGGAVGGYAGNTVGKAIGLDAGQGVVAAYDITVQATSDLFGWTDTGKGDRLDIPDASAIPGLNAPTDVSHLTGTNSFAEATAIDTQIGGRIDSAFAATSPTTSGIDLSSQGPSVFGAGFDSGNWTGTLDTAYGSGALSPGVSSSSGGPTFDVGNQSVFGAGFDTGGWTSASSSSGAIW